MSRVRNPPDLEPPRRDVAERVTRVLGYHEPNDWLIIEGPMTLPMFDADAMCPLST